jgi:hypothetical protein
MKSSPHCHRATTASPTISTKAQNNAREAANRESQITRSLKVDVAALRTQAVLEGFIDFLRDAHPGSPFTPRRSLVRRSKLAPLASRLAAASASWGGGHAATQHAFGEGKQGRRARQ